MHQTALGDRGAPLVMRDVMPVGALANNMKYLLLSLLAFLSLGQLKAPPILEQALARLPGMRLLDPSVDLTGGYTVDELKGFGYWPPWVVRDVDRDGRLDVVAVVVRPAGTNSEFGVLAIHARTPMTVRWVVALNSHRINGVAAGRARDVITPLFCIECDANAWFRWSGRSYEAELYAVGERIAIATYDQDHTVGLFGRPTRASRLGFNVLACTQAVVRRIGGSEQDRWYFVETRARTPIRGWIPAAFATEPECTGA
jgi:hypothetical protein